MTMIQRNFNAIVYTGDKFTGNKGYVKYRKLWRRERFIRFITNKHPNWRFMWLYSRVNDDSELIKRKDIQGQ